MHVPHSNNWINSQHTYPTSSSKFRASTCQYVTPYTRVTPVSKTQKDDHHPHRAVVIQYVHILYTSPVVMYLYHHHATDLLWLDPWMSRSSLGSDLGLGLGSLSKVDKFRKADIVHSEADIVHSKELSFYVQSISINASRCQAQLVWWYIVYPPTVCHLINGEKSDTLLRYWTTFAGLTRSGIILLWRICLYAKETFNK